MIKSLRKRFIILSMLALLVLMLSVVLVMNIVNYSSFVKESDDLLSLISDNRGAFPDFETGGHGKFPPGFTPDTVHQVRYFSVLVDKSGQAIDINTQNISAINRTIAKECAEQALKLGAENGFVGRYRFAIKDDHLGMRISFIDRGRELDAVKNFALTSAIVSTIGYIIILFFVIVVSNRIIKPVAESYDKQKRFITDAGHEMKTPLTIISANVDLYEMENGDNEYVSEIKRQCVRLAELTKSLVYLARLEEKQGSVDMTELPLSELASEAVSSFSVPARLDGKEISAQIDGLITVRGSIELLKRLLSILLDNAVKYSPCNSVINIALSKKGRKAVLKVENDTEAKLSGEDASRIFDRFYRADPSRNSESGGYGIGLSAARSIVDYHQGKIQAYVDGHKFRITVILPM